MHEYVRESLFPQQAEHQNSSRAHCCRSSSYKIKDRQAGMQVERAQTDPERTQVKGETPGWAGGQKEGDRDEVPCVSTSE